MILQPDEIKKISEYLRNGLAIPRDTEFRLSTVVHSALENPGSLVRGQLAYKVLIAHEFNKDHACRVVAAIEYFQTASLMLDDLKCMDDATTRRGQICPHRLYGEASTILAALALINRSYSLFWAVWQDLPKDISTRAASLVEECLGINGVLQGQALDLSFSRQPKAIETTTAIAKKKTATMMRLSLELPGVLCGVSSSEILLLNRISVLWGICYQAIDDMHDILSSQMEAGKSTGKDERLDRPNVALDLGIEGARARIDRMLGILERLMHRLSVISSRWLFLDSLLRYLAKQMPQPVFHRLAS